MAAKLHHTNAVAVYQAGVEGETAYIAMEYVEGQSLDDAVAPGKPLDWREATRAVRDAAAGLAAAHKLGLIHRDVKPANLMRTVDGVVKVADFGLARAQAGQTQLTQEGALLGTPAYMAPELWKREKADPRSDIYALACTYYCLLTGDAPFDGESFMALGYQHTHEPLPDPRQQAPGLPEDVCRIVARGASKEPADRYQTAAEMLADLEALLVSPGRSAADAARNRQGPPVACDAGDHGSGRSDRGPDPAPAALQGGNRPVAALSMDKLSRLLRRHWLPAAIVGLGFFGLFFAAIGGLFKIRTTQGVIVLQVNEANAEVSVDGEKVAVRWGADGKSAEITVPPGKHRVEVKKGGFVVSGSEVSIVEGGREVLNVALKEGDGVETAKPVKPDSDTSAASHQVAASRREVDLLKLVDPAKDAISGKWSFAGGSLVCEDLTRGAHRVPLRAARRV